MLQVMEVITGSVKTNFGANAIASSQLPEGSRYESLQKYIDARAMSSQGPQSMPAEVYAAIVADAALKTTPLPAQLVAGGSSRKFYLTGRWMPRGMWADGISQKLGLHLLTPGGFKGRKAIDPWDPFGGIGARLGVAALAAAALLSAATALRLARGRSGAA